MSRRTRRSFRAAAQRIERAHRAIGVRVPSGLRVIGEELRTDMVASRPGRGVPRDTGNLASTHRVTGPNAAGEVEVSAGGAAAPYAIRQHEDLTLNHPLGEARWMVRAVERWEPEGRSARRAVAEMLAGLEEVAESRGRGR